MTMTVRDEALITSRFTAAALVLFFSLLVVADYLVDAAFVTAGGEWGGPAGERILSYGKFVNVLMRSADWVSSGLVLWFISPAVARIVSPRVVGMHIHDAGVMFGVRLRTIGAVGVLLPPVYFLAQLLVMAIKILVAGTWASEGTVFGLASVYRYMVLASGSLMLASLALFGLGPRIGRALERFITADGTAS